MITLTSLIEQIVATLNKLQVTGVQNAAYVLQIYQNLDTLKSGVEKLEKESERTEVYDEGNNV